jgi:hypothetical protein
MVTRDAQEYLERWWTFGKPRQELRAAMAKIDRYIATVETAKHRVFQFLDGSIVPDNMLVVIASDGRKALPEIEDVLKSLGRLGDAQTYDGGHSYIATAA